MRLLWAIILLSLSSFSQASTITLNYDIFFSHMKTIYKLNYQYVTTAFYLVDRENKNKCDITRAQIRVENNFEPILFQPSGRLLPFYSDKHRKDGAVLVVDINDGKMLSSCDLQVSLMAKERELSSLTTDKLNIISEQLEGVLKKNAGMIGKYFLPTFAGVRLQLSQPVDSLQLTGFNLDSSQAILLSNNELDKINQINELGLNIIRITPWLLTE